MKRTFRMAMEITSRSLASTQPAQIASDTAVQPGTSSGFPAPVQLAPHPRMLRVLPQFVRRNFSSRASQLSGGTAIVLSILKSRRTWIRTFLCVYFCKLHNRDFTFQPGRYSDPGIPRLVLLHELFEL